MRFSYRYPRFAGKLSKNNFAYTSFSVTAQSININVTNKPVSETYNLKLSKSLVSAKLTLGSVVLKHGNTVLESINSYNNFSVFVLLILLAI